MRKYENVKIDKLKPYEKNARTHSEEQIEKIMRSIEEFGFINPVLIDGDFGIIAGHGRVMAGKRLGMTEVPCLFIEDLTEAQKRAYIIADNKLALDAGWDETILKIELAELQEMDFDITLTGFEMEDMELDDYSSSVEEDDFDAEPPAEPKAKFGQIYQLGRHRLMCGDSTDKAMVEKLMDGNKADLVFTDPPYGYNYQSNMRTKTEKFDVLENDDKILDFFPNLIGNVNGFVMICTTWKVLDRWLPLFSTYFELSNMIIWDKGGGGMGDLKHTFSTDYEVILCANNGAEIQSKRVGSVWSIGKDNANDYEHPTQKPVKLSAMAIEHTTKCEDVVLDLFGGSGSTLIACEQLNRTCCIMELDEKYVDVIINRWEQFTGEKAMLISE